MVQLGRLFILVCALELRKPVVSFSYTNGNVWSTIANLTTDGEAGNYSFLDNRTEELFFKDASIDVLDLTVPLGLISPWKLKISDSNVSRIVFPARMTPSVVHVQNVQVEEMEFAGNSVLQDFRADHTSLEMVPPTVFRLAVLDILWVTHSRLSSFNFDLLANSSISLLYLNGNRIETITHTPGVGCCDNLQEIFLSDNRLTTVDFGTFATMSKLKLLFLEHNGLKEATVLLAADGNATASVEGNKTQTFCSWREYYTRRVELANAVASAPPSCTDYFTSLMTIHLARNNFTAIDFGVFRWMNSLNSLDLSTNQVQNLTAQADEIPVRLTELFISNNNISSVHLEPFTDLKALYLNENKIGQLNMSSLPESLDYLNLINNPLNCDDLPQLNRSLSLPSIGPYTEC